MWIKIDDKYHFYSLFCTGLDPIPRYYCGIERFGQNLDETKTDSEIFNDTINPPIPKRCAECEKIRWKEIAEDLLK